MKDIFQAIESGNTEEAKNIINSEGFNINKKTNLVIQL